MPNFPHLKIAIQDSDERQYNHRVRINPVQKGSLEAQLRFTFYPDNGLRWYSHEPIRSEDGRTEYQFPDEATARKFAERFGGEYAGANPLPA